MRYVVLTIMDNEASVFRLWQQYGLICNKASVSEFLCLEFKHRLSKGERKHQTFITISSCPNMQRSDVTGNHHTALYALSQVGYRNNCLGDSNKAPSVGGNFSDTAIRRETRLAGDIAYFAACAEVSKGTLHYKFRIY